MDKITVRQAASGYDVGAITVPSDLPEWLGAVDNGIIFPDWEDMPPAESGRLVLEAERKHLIPIEAGAARVKDEGDRLALTLSGGDVIRIRRFKTGDRMGIAFANRMRRDVEMVSRVSGVPADEILDWAIGDFLFVLGEVDGFLVEPSVGAAAAP